jgi:hypothetical protein
MFHSPNGIQRLRVDRIYTKDDYYFAELGLKKEAYIYVRA